MTKAGQRMRGLLLGIHPLIVWAAPELMRDGAAGSPR
jgi:hypothetical protein